MKSLSDKQYQELKDFASKHKMSLHGYQRQFGGILLRNSVRDGVWGKTMAELKKSILIATQ